MFWVILAIIILVGAIYYARRKDAITVIRKEDYVPLKLIKKHFGAVEDNQNPPFQYLKNKYALSCNHFSESADYIIVVAIFSAKKFKQETSIEIDNQLIHFFFDLHLCLSSKLFAPNYDTDISSAIISGIHFKYFGQPSQNKISTSLDLIATKETCYLDSLFDLFKQEDFALMLAAFAYFSATGELVGAAAGLSISKTVLEIIKDASPLMEARINDIMKTKV